MKLAVKPGSPAHNKLNVKDNTRFLEETLKLALEYMLLPENPMARASLLARVGLLRYRDNSQEDTNAV